LSLPETTLETLRAGGKAPLARCLADLESEAGRTRHRRLLDEAHAAPRGRVIGLTGPPGVGKSTLLARLIDRYRGTGATVGVLAVDPSSRRTGGAVLGDRTRFDHDPEDGGVFVRSLAAGDRLGGLADATFPLMVVLRALFDVVLVETVGVGQSEIEIGEVADSVLLAIQPASGDSLQFIKAGIVEIPDIVVIGKADLGEIAARAQAEIEAALRHATPVDPEWRPPVLRLSAVSGAGVDDLVAALARHAAHQAAAGRLEARRLAQSRSWLRATIRETYGRRGLERLRPALEESFAGPPASPFLLLERLGQALDEVGLPEGGAG